MNRIKDSIAAVIVTYNRKTLLLECIEKLFDQTVDCFDILIVDNHSSDGTYNALKKYLNCSRFHYIDTGSNLGGAGGFQYGMKAAVEAGYEYVWIMDDDSMPNDNALEKLICAYKSLGDNIGFLSSKVMWTDGSICNMNIQRVSATKKVTDFSESVIPIVVASFVSLFIPSTVICDIGLPFKEFFIWTDDWEYTKRIANKYSCYLITESVVVHKTASNTGSNIALDSDDRLDRYRYAYRNEMYFFKREGIRGILYFLAKILYHGIRVLLHADNSRFKRLSIIFVNSFKGLFFSPSIEYPEN